MDGPGRSATCTSASTLPLVERVRVRVVLAGRRDVCIAVPNTLGVILLAVAVLALFRAPAGLSALLPPLAMDCRSSSAMDSSEEEAEKEWRKYRRYTTTPAPARTTAARATAIPVSAASTPAPVKTARQCGLCGKRMLRSGRSSGEQNQKPSGTLYVPALPGWSKSGTLCSVPGASPAKATTHIQPPRSALDTVEMATPQYPSSSSPPA